MTPRLLVTTLVPLLLAATTADAADMQRVGSFEIDRTEVTVEAFAAFVAATGTVTQAEPPMCCDAHAADTPPTSIMPSTPRLSTPLRSVNTPPRAAK